MSNKISQEDTDLINHLMKERRSALNQYGPCSKNFIETNNNFEKLLKKHSLVHSEYNFGFKKILHK